jgi:hypothetical protein
LTWRGTIEPGIDTLPFTFIKINKSKNVENREKIESSALPNSPDYRQSIQALALQILHFFIYSFL